MTPERRQRDQQVLHEALQLSADDRQRLLAHVRDTDPGVSDEVTSLLSAHGSAERELHSRGREASTVS